MDIRAYFHKVREVERTIATPWVVVVSLETPDGGRPGELREVSRDIAAQLIIEGRAQIASEAQANQYREEAERARVHAEQERLSGRMQIAVMSDQEVRALRSGLRPKA